MMGGLVLLVGCDSGTAPEATPAETAKLQKNESEARQKAFGKSGQPNVNSAKAAKAAAAAVAPEAAPAPAPEPAK